MFPFTSLKYNVAFVYYLKTKCILYGVYAGGAIRAKYPQKWSIVSVFLSRGGKVAYLQFAYCNLRIIQLSAHGWVTIVQAERGGWADNTYMYKCNLVSAHSNTFPTCGMQSKYMYIK